MIPGASRKAFLSSCLFAVAALVALALASCSRSTAGEVSSPLGTPASASTVNGFAAAVSKVGRSSLGVRVVEYASGRSVSLDRSHSRFEGLVQYLDKASVVATTPKMRAEDRYDITIPYAIGYTTDFAMNDGSTVRFDAGSSLWFETDEAIYQASVDSGLLDLLRDAIQSAIQLRTLTEADHARVIDIALGSPEALAWLKGRSDYRTGPVEWYAISFKDTRVTGYAIVEPGSTEEGLLRTFGAQSISYYPGVTISVGQGITDQMQIAVDPAAGRTVMVNGPYPSPASPDRFHGLTPSPAPTTVGGCSALAVYLDHPYPGESGIDYTGTPITVTGYVSSPEARMTVNGVEAKVAADGSFSAGIQFKEGGNTIQAVATLGDRNDEMTHMVGVGPDGSIYAIPGVGAGGPRYQSSVLFDHSIELNAGETKVIGVTLESRKSARGPVKFSYTLDLVARVYGQEPLPMPEGLSASIEPSSFTACPNTAYHSTITVGTTGQLAPGDYYLSLSWDFGEGGGGRGWIKVAVVP